MYVVLLDDEREVHLNCRVVDRRQLVRHWDSEDVSVPMNGDHIHGLGPVYPSSVEFKEDSLVSQNSFYSSLLRSCSIAYDNIQNMENGCDDTAYDIGRLDNNNGKTQDEDNNAVAGVPQPVTPTFSNLFNDVFHDGMLSYSCSPYIPATVACDMKGMETETQEVRLPVVNCIVAALPPACQAHSNVPALQYERGSSSRSRKCIVTKAA